MAAVQPSCTSPFKATKLWNQLLCSFKEGMELKRRRWRLKSYDQCFSGSDAIQWLYSYLQNHPSFGSHISREQAFMLLQKFLESNVFQSVVEKNGKKFQDTNHLYRFVNEKLNVKNSEDGKDDKENFNSRTSLTNLIRTISKRNSKYFGEGNSESSPTRDESKDTVGPEKSVSSLKIQNTDASTSSTGITPLTKTLNHVSLLSVSKDNHAFDYSNVSTLLFPTEDEDDGDEVFETSIHNHFFTRSNSVQMYKRDSRRGLRRPLGTLWINELNKTESDFDDIPNSESNDKKNEKKKPILRSFGKTSINSYKKNSILGKRKSGDVNVPPDELHSKLKKVTSSSSADTETNSKYSSLPRKNKKGSQDSLSSGDTLPRKALALLGEDPEHIQEVESYNAYYLVSHEKRVPPPSEKNNFSRSDEHVDKLSRENRTSKSSIGCEDHRKIYGRIQSYSNPMINDTNSRKEKVIQSTPDITKSNPSLNEISISRAGSKNVLKKAKSFSFNVLPSISDKKLTSPKIRKPAQRSHAMIRRSISQSNVKWRRHLSSTTSSSDMQEGYPFNETELIFDNNRLYKVPSTWSIDTIGLMKDSDEESNDKPPEITAEDVEETWKSVVILSLRKLLGLVSVKELFDITEVSGASIMKNVSWKPSEISRDAPGWLLSAMNCLIDWPNVSQNAEDSILQDLPSYPGFERDVYRAVKEHYDTTLSRPLVPSHLYPLVQECSDVLHENEDKGIRIMQHIILLLPCWNRRQLQLLVHFMNKVASNDLLQISKDLSNRDLVIHSFLHLIVHKDKPTVNLDASVIPIRIATLLIDSYEAVFKAPPSLRGQVDHKLAVILGKPNSSSAPVNEPPKRRVSADEDRKQMPPPRYYCKQITKEAYEKEAMEYSQKAIHDVLTTYINDPTFTEKERTKRLKQFQKAYPEIYAERFPLFDDVSNCSTISEFSMNFKEAAKPSFLTEKLL